MPPVPSWAYPTVFELTNPFNGSMVFNEQTSSGIYLAIQEGCDFQLAVRSTTDNVPQSDGSILHHRFLTGSTLAMTLQLWETRNDIPCETELLTEMLDELSGALRSLLNVEDNQGRLSWTVPGGDERMLDDVRLVVYPSFVVGPPPTVTFTLDCRFPYAQNLTQELQPIADGTTETINNVGTAAYFPVIQINKLNGALSGDDVCAFTITVENIEGTTQFNYDCTLPPGTGLNIGPTHYAEMENFNNTLFLDGDGANLSPGISQLDSDYFSLAPGDNDVTIDGADCDVLWAPAWG